MPTLAVVNFNIVCATLGGFITVFGLVSYLVKEKYYLSEALISLAAARSDLQLSHRAWVEDDLSGVLIGLCDAADDDEARRFAEAGRRRGVPVNVVDKPDFCDFQFGTLVSRGPLVLVNSTTSLSSVPTIRISTIRYGRLAKQISTSSSVEPTTIGGLGTLPQIRPFGRHIRVRIIFTWVSLTKYTNGLPRASSVPP